MTAPDRPDRLGRRVVVRYRRPAGSRPPLTDVVGVVTAVDGDGLVVEGSAGPVRVHRSDIVLLKAAPPPPVRRGRPHTAVGTVGLERIMADGWRAVEEEWLGDWLLRASSGFTTRGNSVLPLGDAGRTLAEAVSVAETWYAERGLPSAVHLSLPVGAAARDDPLGAHLLDRGYRWVTPTFVMTAACADITPLREGRPRVSVSAVLEPEWLEAYARQRATLPGVTEKILTGSPDQRFLSTSDGSGAVTSVARMSIHPGWAGLQAVWVDPELRGQGLGRTLLHEAAALARRGRMASMFLQVEADHDHAVRLYESEGFRTHHVYGYLWRENGDR